MTLYEQLKRPFAASKISWRVGAVSYHDPQTKKQPKAAIALAYIDARDVMERLDDVFGLNWQSKHHKDGAVTFCEIGVLIDGQWIWREGGAGDTDVEAEKGAASDAFKRAAVLFGIGRYLYDLPNEWVEVNEYKKFTKKPTLPMGFFPIVTKGQENEYIKQLTDEALPREEKLVIYERMLKHCNEAEDKECEKRIREAIKPKDKS